ncbi:hypothetical protein SAMD00023353_3700480 [Rosellinia necatrix]|uniref:Uncharacterized protein n=1 Tax=Rosellinia necatrix TaxID=77044 RepID=A0A1S8A940_ROSNE|nr:hypothetical protein SAMD00023353_3700480 [Rosellinia necatrix]
MAKPTHDPRSFYLLWSRYKTAPVDVFLHVSTDGAVRGKGLSADPKCRYIDPSGIAQFRLIRSDMRIQHGDVQKSKTTQRTTSTYHAQ